MPKYGQFDRILKRTLQSEYILDLVYENPEDLSVVYLKNSPRKQNTPVAITSSSRMVPDKLARPIKDTKPAAIIKNMWISDHQNSIFLHGKFLISHIHSFHLQPKIKIDIKLVKRLKIHNRYSLIHGTCDQFTFSHSIDFVGFPK